MKKTILSFLLVLLGLAPALADNLVTGNGNTGTISVASVNGGQSWKSLEAGAAWTINVEVENPDGAHYNDWGSTILASGTNAFPEKNSFNGFQLYLQSSTYGGKLNAVFDGGDHTIDNVTYTGDFSAMIRYDGDKKLELATKNASGTQASNTYTLSKALPAIESFAYGLPTGINIKSLEIIKPSNDFTLDTQGTLVDGKYYEYSSPKCYYAGTVNTLRFNLTQSGAFYHNGKNRMSLREFYLYKADGTEVSLQAECFSGNYDKTYANMLDRQETTFCNASWYSADQGDDYFEIALPEDVDLGGAFSFKFTTENKDMWTQEFQIQLSYKDPTPQVPPTEFTLHIKAPEGTTVSPTYNGEAVTEGRTFTEGDFDADLFASSEVEGYYWRILVDKAKATLTLQYTQATDEVNPTALVDLVKRIGGEEAAGKFKFVLNPALSSKPEKFILGSEDDKVLLKGSSLSAITAGLGWYLNHVAHINISWNSLNEKSEGQAYADLSTLPLPAKTEEHTCDAQYRYYLNYCTFGYSMTTWTWKRWQQEIDWMALHGINMPLQIVGLEEVWRKFLTLEAKGSRKYNYTDEEAKAFVAGPAFTAWWGMNNLEGWGGTSSDGWGGVQDDAWYARQKTLAQHILARQRELGMQPVLPGFSGMVPSNFTSKTSVATDDNGGGWGGFTRPYIIDPTDRRFADIAKDYYACLAEVMGESQYYSMDPFHEGGSISSGKYAEAYKAVYDAMETAKPNSQWVIQQWQWNSNQKLSLSSVPMGKLIVLDLFSDGSPAFDGYNGYAPQHAVFCAIPNFGGRSGVMGRLQNVTDNYFKFKEKYTSVKGIGAAPEAIEQTPVTYDLIFELCWMNGAKPDVSAWVDDYATNRYGSENATAQAAWQLLRQSALAYGADGIQGPVEDVWAARPNLDASPASSWGVTLNNAGGTYTPARRQMLIDATCKLLDIASDLNLPVGSVQESNYLYDLVEFGGAVMADYAYDLLKGIKAAKDAAGESFESDATYKTRRDAFLALIADMDAFKGTNLNFRLGKWTQEARDAAAEVTGATTATPDWYEFNNARTLITTWGDQGQNGGLKDYSYRSWQGLLKDYYLPRWQYYFSHGCQGCNYFFFEWNWAHGMTHAVGDSQKSTTRLTEGAQGYSYTRAPEGSTLAQARALLDKYLMPVTLAQGTHYAYRFLANDLSSKVTIVAHASTTLNLKSYFGNLEGATLTGDFVEGTPTDLSQVAVKTDATDGTHTGTLTWADGTVVTFSVVLNPSYYGTYHITYNNNGSNAPLFICYNEDKDNGNNKGYKLIATGTYSTSSEADKIFTLTPNGSGYSISAQGMYLRQPFLSGWQHVMFSGNAAEAGAYIMEADGDYFKIKSTGSGKNYLNDYDNLVMGNDASNKENLSTFSITRVESFPLQVGEVGLATLCLPFHVTLPEGMTAYDVALADVGAESQDGTTTCILKSIAHAGEVLKAGTPVIVKAGQGQHSLTITMDGNGAKTSLAGSLLKGNYVSQTLTQGETTKKFIFMKPQGEPVGFYRMKASSQIAANKCWMEWEVPQSQEVHALVLSFEETGIDDVNIVPRTRTVYNLQGQRVSKPKRGIYIVEGRKMVCGFSK